MYDYTEETLTHIMHLIEEVKPSSFPSFYKKLRYFLDCKMEKHLEETYIPPVLTYDNLGWPCSSCGRGQYLESSVVDNIVGTLSCNKCGVKVMRWANV